jgi:hypothetical protein
VPTQNALGLENHHYSVRLLDCFRYPSSALIRAIPRRDFLQPLVPILFEDSGLAKCADGSVWAFVGGYAKGHSWISLNMQTFHSTEARRKVEQPIVVDEPDWAYSNLPVPRGS